MTNDDKALVERLREPANWAIERPLVELREEAASRIEALSAENERLEKAIKVQASAVRTLQANEQTEINLLRKQKTECHRAVTSLDSEREANAILTAEVERLREALKMLDDAYCNDDYSTLEGKAKGRAALVAARRALGEQQ